MRFLRRGTVTVALWLCTVAGCVNPFAPRLDNAGQQNALLTEQKTPEEVLQNFAYAYTFRDSLLYADLLDSSFVFEFFDPTLGESGAFESWGREVELRTTGGLFRAFDAIELIWLNTLYQSTVSPTEEILYKNFRLTLVGSDLNFTLQGYAIFTFRLDADGRWRIKRWVDETNL
ncbi:MAG: hypothetical protein D6743_19860 [Calditrichaeota bacterium]|nr:MAG: hypothetical protein D6743_19860 [Calditrichota bacterium]